MRTLIIFLLVTNTCLGQFTPQPNNILAGHTSTAYTYYDDIQYGENNIETFDAFIPSSGFPVGAVFNFHGGGFVVGNKDNVYNNNADLSYIGDLLDNGIAYINFNYRLMEFAVEEEGVIKSLNSAKRGVQFVAHYSGLLNIDPDFVIYTGSSAGAGIAMWLAYQGDFNTGNPIGLEISLTNITPIAVVLNIPQASYDLGRWEDTVFTSLGYNLLLDATNNPSSASDLLRFYGLDSLEDFNTPDTIAYRNSVDMLSMIENGGGVPTYINSSSTLHNSLTNFGITDINHSPYMGEAIRTALLDDSIEVLSNVNGLSGDLRLGVTELNYIIGILGNE